MKTTIKIENKEVTISGVKERVQKIAHVLTDYQDIQMKTLSGECICSMFAFGKKEPVWNWEDFPGKKEQFDNDLKNYVERIPSTIDKDTKISPLSVMWWQDYVPTDEALKAIKEGKKTDSQREQEQRELAEKNSRYEAMQKAGIEAKKQLAIAEKEMLEKYPHLSPANSASKNIKIHLTKTYPGVKFSVTSDSFSMGNSIDVKYTDGPAIAEVKDFCDQFENSCFNAMEDISEYVEHAMHVFGSTKYMHVTREISDKFIQETIDENKETIEITLEKYREYSKCTMSGEERENLYWEVKNLDDILDKRSEKPKSTPVVEKPVQCSTIPVSIDIENEPNSEKERILQGCTIVGNVVKLPDERLSRELYVEVASSINLIGGKWNRKEQGFVFVASPVELMEKIANGNKVNLKKEYQFFETPEELSNTLVELANIQPEDTVLEPSAGQGAIIKAINNKGFIPYCCELMPVNKSILEMKNKSGELKHVFLQDNFLKLQVSARFDKIIANPPFSGNQDIDHVMQMYDWLLPGGRIVSVVSNSWAIGSQKKQIAFREWLDRVGAVIEPIEPGTFKESGTMVGANIIVIDK